MDEAASTSPSEAPEFHLPRKFAYCHEVTSIDLTLGTMLRLFRNAPDSVDVQLRTFGPITESGRGMSKHMIAGTRLSLEEARTVRDQLDKFILAAGGNAQASPRSDSAPAFSRMFEVLTNVASELEYLSQRMRDPKDGEALTTLKQTTEEAVGVAKTAMGWNRNHVFVKEVEGYRLSVIERNYDTAEGTMRGRESAILTGPAGSRTQEFIRGTDYSQTFAALSTAADVRAFIEKANAQDED